MNRALEPVIAIGASAGGLEALLELLPALKKTGRNRYLVAQHMSKTGHAELVVRVLGRKSALPVVEARDGMRIEPDVVYLMPAGTDGVFDDGRVYLREPDHDALSTPSVDALFESVARNAGPAAIAVVLSGAGSDGVAGAAAVRAKGGTVLVQGAATTAVQGMTGAVVRQSLANAVLTPAEIAEHINKLAPAKREPIVLKRHPYTGSPKLQVLLERMSEHAGVDFTQYRQGTLLRRMERRREALKFDDLDAYIEYVMSHPDESEALQRLFLISWSWFYRDASAFARLRFSIEQALSKKSPDSAFTIWVPGCATGEECYSLAMLVHDLDPEREVRVIGSDLNAEALRTARAARYKATSLREVPTGFTERYFRRDSEMFRVSDTIRGMCAFVEEDVLSATPAGPFDLVSCRNLLIYMKVELHEQLLDVIHDALRAEGLLFLGLSEGIARNETARFTAIDATHRIYRRKAL